MLKLGQKVKDRVTNFRGVATARCEYMDDEPLVRVEAPVGMDGKAAEPVWFKEKRLIVEK